MNDYFDELEAGLRDVVRRRGHLRWYARLGQLSMRHRGLAAIVAVFVIATPAVAAVGAASGWFSKGSSDNYYPASAEVRAQVSRFFASYHLTTRSGTLALLPRCGPVGWVEAKGPKVTAADVTAPLKVSISEGRRFCSKGP